MNKRQILSISWFAENLAVLCYMQTLVQHILVGTQLSLKFYKCISNNKFQTISKEKWYGHRKNSWSIKAKNVYVLSLVSVCSFAT